MMNERLDWARAKIVGLAFALLQGCSGDAGGASAGSLGGTSSNTSSSSTTTTSTGGTTSLNGSGGATTIHGGSGNYPNAGAATGGAYVEPVEAYDPDAAPAPVVTVNLSIPANGIAQLDADPYNGPDILGAFVDANGKRYEPIEVNYRGAYALQNLIILDALQRNWKLKFAKDLPYQNRREWNLNFEPHIRQRLAYWLMHLAGVKLPTARHVVLHVNGTVHGLYLEYEDPDNKSWLLDEFGDNEGDLYKAAHDIPGETPHFATLENLGSNDSDYLLHYDKKTNNDDPVKAEDYSSLRAFITALNSTPDGEFEAFLRRTFDVQSFISYLVVGNFISHWDALPQRPKNYWLYQIPATGKWVFIPWDLDATFQSRKGYLNVMGTDASIFFQFDRFVDYMGRNPAEGTARPLITRMMKVPAFRSAYVARYRAALSSFLARDYLLARVSALGALVSTAAQPDELETISEAQADIQDFINRRTTRVTTELADVP